MTAAILWSGGKDCAFALFKAREAGIDVKYAITGFFSDMTIPPTEEIIIEQCKSAKLQPIIIHCDLITFHKAIQKHLPKDVDTLVYGEAHTTNDIIWFKQFCQTNNLKDVIPLFKYGTEKSMNEFFSLGFKCIITRLITKDMHYGGSDYTLRMFNRNKNAFEEPFGVASHMQTFVYDGPIFETPVVFSFEKAVGGRVRKVASVESS